MTLWFTSGVSYTYCGVPQLVFDGLVGARSAGTYFSDNIRDLYQC